MKGMNLLKGLAPLFVLAVSTPALALTVGTTETFDTDTAGWLNATSGPLTWVSSGGPDGSSYTESTFASINDPGTIQFRAGTTSSGGAFAGDWVAGGVSFLSVDVIHDAPAPLDFFFRIATGGGFPAFVGIVPAPVPGGTWTTIGLAISPSNGLLIPEGSFTFADVFSAVTNVQIGVSVPVDFEGVPFTYGIDNVQVVPEPPPPGMPSFLSSGAGRGCPPRARDLHDARGP